MRNHSFTQKTCALVLLFWNSISILIGWFSDFPLVQNSMHYAIFFGCASCWELIDQTNQPLSFSQCGNRTSPYLSIFSAEECFKKLWRQWWSLFSSSHRFHWLMKNANMVPPISISVKRHVTLATAGAQWINYHNSVAALKSAILILLVTKWCVRVSAAFVFYKVTFDPFFSLLT